MKQILGLLIVVLLGIIVTGITIAETPNHKNGLVYLIDTENVDIKFVVEIKNIDADVIVENVSEPTPLSSNNIYLYTTCIVHNYDGYINCSLHYNSSYWYNPYQNYRTKYKHIC